MQDPKAFAQQITGLMRQGRVADAHRQVQAALTHFPTHPLILRIASEVAAMQNDYGAAVSFAKEALAAAPGDPGLLMHLALCQARAGDEAHATEAALKAAAAAPVNAMVQSHVATMLSRMDENDEAQRLYARAVELEPQVAQHHFNLATVQQFLGQLDAAEASCNEALRLNPHHFEAMFTRARLKRQTPASNHIDALRKAAGEVNLTPLDRAFVGYALAKELEDLGDYDAAFAAMSEAASAYRSTLSYDPSRDASIYEAITRRFDMKFPDKGEVPLETDQPIFIVGLPRTGTTLVERIIGSHSEVTAAGELPYFAHAIRSISGANVEDSYAWASGIIAKEYLRRVPAKYMAARHFIDKLPENALNVGHIAKGMPHAAIIELTRGPMDTCLAMYKTLFNQSYPATYQLEELAAYYANHRRLMAHWKEVFPGRITEVAYEDVVADQKVTSERLLSACGLNWEESVLDFHKNEQATATASAGQVRQPLYASSVGAWRHYEKHLAPLADELQKRGIDIA